MRKIYGFIIGMVVLTVGLASCKKELYDEEKYEQYIKYMSKVDSVDQQHQWQLTSNYLVNFTANVGTDIRRVQVYTANPLTDQSAELMNQAYVSNGETVSLMLTAPTILNTFYAALVDGSGHCYVKSLAKGQTNLDFSGATEGTLLSGLQPQAFTYLFEENIPEVGDYDYNDLVLRLAVERTGQREATIHVTIVAVGADHQLAGAIRLLGYKYADIDSVRTTTGTTFNEGVPQGSMFVFDRPAAGGPQRRERRWRRGGQPVHRRALGHGLQHRC